MFTLEELRLLFAWADIAIKQYGRNACLANAHLAAKIDELIQAQTLDRINAERTAKEPAPAPEPAPAE
jgi:hypothetical protein